VEWIGGFKWQEREVRCGPHILSVPLSLQLGGRAQEAPLPKESAMKFLPFENDKTFSHAYYLCGLVIVPHPLQMMP
jgi:hypothetical protein